MSGPDAPNYSTAGALVDHRLGEIREWAEKPRHRSATEQLREVLAVAARQLAELPERPALAQDRTLELWRLREPGHLRDLVEHPPRRVSGGVVLLPVLLTWFILGAFELWYVRSQADVPAAKRPSFFDAWLANDWFLSPVLLSLCVIVPVLWLMDRYRRAAAAQRRQDHLENQLRRFEVDLLAPLTQLRENYLATAAGSTPQLAAEAVWAAARELRGAAERLGGSVGAAEQLGTALERLLERLPDLGAQAERLSAVQEGLEAATDFVVEETQPLVELVERASTTATTLERAMTIATEMVKQAQELGNHVTRSIGMVDHTREPLVVASEQVRMAAERMGGIVGSLQTVINGLHDTIDRVNFLSLVADGLRAEEHAGNGRGSGPHATA